MYPIVYVRPTNAGNCVLFIRMSSCMKHIYEHSWQWEYALLTGSCWFTTSAPRRTDYRPPEIFNGFLKIQKWQPCWKAFVLFVYITLSPSFEVKASKVDGWAHGIKHWDWGSRHNIWLIFLPSLNHVEMYTLLASQCWGLVFSCCWMIYYRRQALLEIDTHRIGYDFDLQGLA